MTVDLPSSGINCGGKRYPFELEENARQMLLKGLDPIDMTQLHEAAIGEFEDRDRKQRPWVYEMPCDRGS